MELTAIETWVVRMAIAISRNDRRFAEHEKVALDSAMKKLTHATVVQQMTTGVAYNSDIKELETWG